MRKCTYNSINGKGKMADCLYDSSICRLCSEDNDGGTLLYSVNSINENKKSLDETINTYLPVKVKDDGKLPRTICPGCTIQIEATVEFFDLIIKGQQILRDLYKKQQGYLREQTDPLALADNVLIENYPDDHPLVLKAAGLEKPKRKRGRPPKKVKSPEEVEQEILETEKERLSKKMESEEPSGKRRRKTPTRFKEVVQGEELERILVAEGVASEESGDESNAGKTTATAPLGAPEVIGHLAASGELVLMAKGKGRGRPKGSLKQQRSLCSICGESFTCSGRYMRHVAAHGPVVYRCEQCQLTYNNRLEIDNHQEETGHQGRKVMKQEKEQQEDQKVSDLETASDPLSGISEAPTPADDASLADSVDQEQQTVKHEVKEVTLDFNNQIDENASCTDMEPNVVDNANEETESSPNKSKKKLKCNYCPKEFSSKQSKSLHIKASHKGERPYTCNECGAKFAYPRSLALHKISHKKKAGLGKGYACDLCGKVLNHPSSVIYHKESEHAGHRYVCNKCNKSFKHKQLLQRHQLVHTQLRPWVCKHCPASFKTKANLLNHSVLHTGNKRHGCPLCKQKFSHKTSLTLHLRWHQGIKPFTCNFCSKSFTQKGNLSEHIRIHTGERPYQCTKCPKTFTTSSQRRLHLKRHDNFNNKLEDSIKRELSCGCEDVKLCPHVTQQPVVNKIFKLTKQTTKPNKLSLLMHQESEEQEAEVMAIGEGDDEEEENVIYVTYDVDDQNESGFQILGTEPTNKILPQNFFSGASLLVPDHLNQIQMSNQIQIDANQLHIESDINNRLSNQIQIGNRLINTRVLSSGQINEVEIDDEDMVETIEIEEPSLDELPELMDVQPRIPVTDEAGNPLHFTMADGTRLAITSADGKSLQVVTNDGQTIPVEINNFVNEVANDSQTIVHHLNLQKTNEATEQVNEAPVTHYYTIV